VERVTGIGGVFFRAQDPENLAAWYAHHLGIDPAPATYDASSWWQQAGPTVFTAMAAESEHFGGAERSWSINFRVADLDAMVVQLQGAGIQVDVDPESYPNGRFASLQDPEGNVLQLWQPAGADGRGPA
jgi:glyoxylase I family protein